MQEGHEEPSKGSVTPPARSEHSLPGLEMPRPTTNERQANLYKQYSLSEAPSLSQIEPIATKLLKAQIL